MISFFPRHLAKFQSITNITTRVFWTFISTIYRRHWFNLFQFFVQDWSEWRHILKNTAWIEIIITFSTAIALAKIKQKLWPLGIRGIFHTYCCHNFNPWGIFQNVTSFTPIFNHWRKGSMKINGGQKNVSSILRHRLKFRKMSRAGKTYCTQNCKKKIDIENFIIGALKIVNASKNK